MPLPHAMASRSCVCEMRLALSCIASLSWHRDPRRRSSSYHTTPTLLNGLSAAYREKVRLWWSRELWRYVSRLLFVNSLALVSILSIPPLPSTQLLMMPR